ncbi:hypothetical protein ID866_6307 [Astraeus odoratus]|nr:hypothetical protein ID866_6307 [Astraeus odoratus]
MWLGNRWKEMREGLGTRRLQGSSGLCAWNIKIIWQCDCDLLLVLPTTTDEKGIYPQTHKGGPFRHSSL